MKSTKLNKTKIMINTTLKMPCSRRTWSFRLLVGNLELIQVIYAFLPNCLCYHLKNTDCVKIKRQKKVNTTSVGYKVAKIHISK